MDAVVRLAQPVADRLLRHAEAGRPEEVCGILIGTATADEVRVEHVVPARNVWTPAEERERRYALDPADQVAAERAARADGLDVVGYYHSHPVSPPVPSGLDREMAWPGYVYLIAGLADAGPASLRAWMLDKAGLGFVELHVDQAG